jgi:hypothetical protein
MISVESHVGRLIEIRMSGTITERELQDQLPKFRKVCALAGNRAVLCVDQRMMNILPQNVADSLLRIMRDDNPIVVRSAVVVGKAPVQAMQQDRLRRQAAGPERRLFVDPKECIDWLSEVLGEEEQKRLHRFLEIAV